MTVMTMNKLDVCIAGAVGLTCALYGAYVYGGHMDACNCDACAYGVEIEVVSDV